MNKETLNQLSLKELKALARENKINLKGKRNKKDILMILSKELKLSKTIDYKTRYKEVVAELKKVNETLAEVSHRKEINKINFDNERDLLQKIIARLGDSNIFLKRVNYFLLAVIISLFMILLF